MHGKQTTWDKGSGQGYNNMKYDPKILKFIVIITIKGVYNM